MLMWEFAILVTSRKVQSNYMKTKIELDSPLTACDYI